MQWTELSDLLRTAVNDLAKQAELQSVTAGIMSGHLSHAL